MPSRSEISRAPVSLPGGCIAKYRSARIAYEHGLENIKLGSYNRHFHPQVRLITPLLQFINRLFVTRQVTIVTVSSTDTSGYLLQKRHLRHVGSVPGYFVSKIFCGNGRRRIEPAPRAVGQRAWRWLRSPRGLLV